MGNTFPFPREAWMPWKECSVMDERLRFVAWLLDGEAMSEVCRAFGISRKTGYKIFERFKEHGLEALTGREAGLGPQSSSFRSRTSLSSEVSIERLGAP